MIKKAYQVVELAALEGVACPCGVARRAFSDVDSPFTVHLTEISQDAKLHYHKIHTEAYYVLHCAADAKMQLDEEIIPLRIGQCILIPPYVRHRAIGKMQAIIVSCPAFDSDDEWFD